MKDPDNRRWGPGLLLWIRQQGARALLVTTKLELQCAARAVLEVGSTTPNRTSASTTVSASLFLSLWILGVWNYCCGLFFFFFFFFFLCAGTGECELGRERELGEGRDPVWGELLG